MTNYRSAKGKEGEVQGIYGGGTKRRPGEGFWPAEFRRPLDVDKTRGDNFHCPTPSWNVKIWNNKNRFFYPSRAIKSSAIGHIYFSLRKIPEQQKKYIYNHSRTGTDLGNMRSTPSSQRSLSQRYPYFSMDIQHTLNPFIIYLILKTKDFCLI